MAFVPDASVAAAWVLPDEAAALASKSSIGATWTDPKANPARDPDCSVSRLDVAPLRISGARADFVDKPARYQLGQTGSGRARRESDRAGDLAGTALGAAFQQIEDGAVGRIDVHLPDPAGMQRDPQANPDLIPYRWSQARLPTCGKHPRDAAAPLLHQSELMEHTADHPVSQQ